MTAAATTTEAKTLFFGKDLNLYWNAKHVKSFKITLGKRPGAMFIKQPTMEALIATDEPRLPYNEVSVWDRSDERVVEVVECVRGPMTLDAGTTLTDVRVRRFPYEAVISMEYEPKD
jgi:hypothetical protein